MRRTSWLALGLVATGALAAWAAVEQGRVITQEARVRAVKRKFGDALLTLHAGDAVDILQKEPPWFRVGRGGVEGWLHESAVTRDKNYVFASAMVPTGDVEATARSAGQKGFDATTEKAYRATKPQLESAFRKVDGLDAAVPDETRIARFVADGALAGGAQ